MKRQIAYLKNIIAITTKMLDIRDVFIFGGVGLMACGIWQIYPPASAIISGSIFFWLGIRRIK